MVNCFKIIQIFFILHKCFFLCMVIPELAAINGAFPIHNF